MLRRTLLVIFLLSVSLAAQVPSYRIKARSISELQADQRMLIGQWCRLDYEGSRLTDDGWKKFDTLTSFKHNPDFNSVYVISRYQMTPPDRASMSGSVSYMVVGRYEVGIGYTPMNDNRLVDFKFAEKDGELQIVDIDPVQPNVSKPAFINWVKAQIASTKNASDKLALQQALNLLVPPPPKPKAEEGSSSSKQTQ
jgi:hypothetical protein